MARELKVAERMRETSDQFSIRQVASIHSMSVPGLKAFAERHNISFRDTSGVRSKRVSSELLDRERQHVQAMRYRSFTRDRVTSIDSEKITPALRELAKRRDLEESNKFVRLLVELSKTHTKEQATRELGISPSFMRNIAYEHQLTFIDDANPLIGLTLNAKRVEQIEGKLFVLPSELKQAEATEEQLLAEQATHGLIADFIRRRVINDFEDEA